jgi:hypothetical protein
VLDSPGMKLYALILLTVLQTSAFATVAKEDCTDVDQTAALGPQRNQGDAGWCYAYTAADLLSFKIKQTVSAAAVVFSSSAIHFGRKTVKNTEGGETKGAMQRALREGLCLEKNFSSNGDDVIALFNANPTGFKSMLNAQCGERIHPDSIRIRQKRLKGDLQVLNEQLTANNIVAADIDSAAFLTTEKKFWFPDHADLIVGRRWNQAKDRCEYMIRNSWGQNCAGGMPGIVECDRGNFWIPDTAVEAAVSNVHYLDL